MLEENANELICKCPTCNKAFVENNLSCLVHFLGLGGGGRGKWGSFIYRWFSPVTFEGGILKVDI